MEERTQESCQTAIEGALSKRQRGWVEAVSMDMWPADISAVEQALPSSDIVHDRFHIGQHLNQAVDSVRKEEHRVLLSDGDCIVKEYRKIRNDHTFNYGNKFYFIESPLKHSFANQKIEIRKDPHGQFSGHFAGRCLRVSEVIEPTKASIVDIDIQKKLDVLVLADKLGNVSEASRQTGVSRDTIYRHRRLVKQGGTDALKSQEKQNGHHKNRAAEELEKLVIDFSLKNPHLGQGQVSRQLNKLHFTHISSTGVRNIWLREKMNTIGLRLSKVNIQIKPT